MNLNLPTLPTLESNTWFKHFSLAVGLGALTLGVFIATPFIVRAQSASELNEILFTAIPPRTEVIQLKPGETKQINLELRNGSAATMPVYVEVKDFIISDDGVTPIPLETAQGENLRWSLANWISAQPSSTELEPGETGSFALLISAPEDALPGGHYAMVLYSPNPVDPRSSVNNSLNETQTAAVVSGKVGTLVYVEVEGEITENAFIRSFTAPQWAEYGPVEMRYVVENLSDIHITPKTSITVRNFLGQVKEVIPVEAQNVFPYATREFVTSFDQTWGIGPYTAQLTMGYGKSGKVATSTTVFWIIPYRIILAGLLFVAVLLTVVILIRRHLEHKNDDRSEHIEILEDRIRELEERLTENDK